MGTITTRENELVALQNTLYTSSNPTRKWLHCSRRDWIAHAITTYADKSRETNALEVGPGSGVYLPILARTFSHVTAVDIEEAYLNNAKVYMQEHANLSLRVDNILQSSLQKASYDFILCTEVVEHIADSQTAIAQMRQLLKPGGVLLLTTPQRYSPLEQTAKIAFLPGIVQMVKLIYNEPVLEMGHINLMTAAKVKTQLESAGFTIVETFKSGLYLPLVAEFCGQRGLKVEQWLESKIRGTFLDGVLWTQYYIARS